MPEPKRDFSSELIAAVAAVAVMAFALVFGILLTLSSNSNTSGGAGATGTVVMMMETVSATVVPPSLTPTATFTLTFIPSATLTSDFTATDTPTYTSTDTPTSTPTVISTSTATFTYTATSTKSVTATATRTVQIIASFAPSATKTATLTKAPATVTSTRTLAATPTAIHTATTEITVTATYTATLKPSTTAIPATLTPTMSVTPTDTPTSELEGTTAACSRPAGWVVYLLQPGDTLATIAEAVDSTIQQLGRVNCIISPDTLLVGDVLYVPQLPEGAPDASDDILVGCEASEIAVLTQPEPGDSLDKVVKLRGTATTGDANFGYYRIEVRPDASRIFEFYLRSDLSMLDSDLGILNPAGFDRGRHWLRLVIVRRDGTIQPDGICAIPVNFD